MANMNTDINGPWAVGNSDSVLHDEVTELVGADGKAVLEIGWGGFACESDPGGAYPILEASDDVWALIKAAPDMLTMLEELEWIDDRRGPNGIVSDSVECRRCMSCFNFEPDGHAAYCKLAALLKQF